MRPSVDVVGWMGVTCLPIEPTKRGNVRFLRVFCHHFEQRAQTVIGCTVLVRIQIEFEPMTIESED